MHNICLEPLGVKMISQECQNIDHVLIKPIGAKGDHLDPVNHALACVSYLFYKQSCATFHHKSVHCFQDNVDHNLFDHI